MGEEKGFTEATRFIGKQVVSMKSTLTPNIKEPLAPSDCEWFYKNAAYLFAAFLTVA
jgi:hypothetical protein